MLTFRTGRIANLFDYYVKINPFSSNYCKKHIINSLNNAYFLHRQKYNYFLTTKFFIKKNEK